MEMSTAVRMHEGSLLPAHVTIKRMNGLATQRRLPAFCASTYLLLIQAIAARDERAACRPAIGRAGPPWEL